MRRKKEIIWKLVRCWEKPTAEKTATERRQSTIGYTHLRERSGFDLPRFGAWPESLVVNTDRFNISSRHECEPTGTGGLIAWHWHPRTCVSEINGHGSTVGIGEFWGLLVWSYDYPQVYLETSSFFMTNLKSLHEYWTSAKLQRSTHHIPSLLLFALCILSNHVDSCVLRRAEGIRISLPNGICMKHYSDLIDSSREFVVQWKT